MSDLSSKPDTADDAVARIIRLAGKRPVAADEVRARVYASTHAAWRNSVAAQRPQLRQWWLAAAAALAVVATGIAVLRTSPPAPGASPLASVQAVRGAVLVARAGSLQWQPTDVAAAGALHAGDALRTLPGAAAVVALNYGTSLRLNENTDLVLQGATRLDLAHGTIYLDSGAQAPAANGVHVTTPLGVVSDMGTQFELHGDAQQLRIRVREGAVTFQGGDREVHGTAGDEVLIPTRGAPVRGSIGPTDEAWNWVTDLATFGRRGEYSAATLLQWVSRETGRRLQFDSPATAAHAQALRLHGAEALSPQEALDVVAATTDLRCEVAGTQILVHVVAP